MDEQISGVKALDVLTGSGDTVATSAGVVKIRKVTLRDVSPITGFLANAIQSLGHEIDFKNAVNSGSFDFKDPSVLFRLISANADEAIRVLTPLTSMSVEELESLPLDEAYLVLSTAAAVNIDFFMEKVLPAHKRAMDRIQAKG